MKVDACDAACSMNHKISVPLNLLADLLYICIIEVRNVRA
jgi:hypothetical protein